MKIDPHTAALTIHGLELAAGARLEDLRASRPKDLQHPLIANGRFETYRLEDNEAASHLVFKNGQLWQIRTSLFIPEDAKGRPTETSERLRHALHEAGANSRCNGNAKRAGGECQH